MNRIQKEKTAQQVKQDRVKNYASLSKKLRSQFSDTELIEALAMLEVCSHGLSSRAVVYNGQWDDTEYVTAWRKIRSFLNERN
jgi:hypothetical protein